MDESQTPRLTYKVSLPGGQQRLREAALYVMEKCAECESFGLTKLNKILWRADFTAFARRRQPVTGRIYQKLKYGPAPVEMQPLLNELQRGGYMTIERRGVVPFVESRPVGLVSPSLRHFSEDDLAFLDEAIRFYWDYTATGVSNQSHGVAWKTREIGDPMPYESSLLSDERLAGELKARLLELGKARRWKTT